MSSGKDKLPSNRTTLLAFMAIFVTGALLSFPLVLLGMPDLVRIPKVEEHDDEAAALFSHGSHDQYRCYACHEGIFPQAKKGFTHADMDEGRYCGACHDGKIAWAVDDDEVECEACHVER